MSKDCVVVALAALVVLATDASASDAFLAQVGGVAVRTAVSVPQIDIASASASVAMPRIESPTVSFTLAVPRVPPWMTADSDALALEYALPTPSSGSTVADLVQVGYYNSSSIQQNIGNAVAVIQYGDHNTAQLRQLGSGNAAAVHQAGSWMNSVIFQSGTNNRSLVVQAD